ncbi:hypothetical protein BV20DRAFT_1117471 [Pilatotrama ljubarskyi]|nr:hypothetical protein BV20DRAFT_1117471 [Pilatotrama ljubarskyi]
MPPPHPPPQCAAASSVPSVPTATVRRRNSQDEPLILTLVLTITEPSVPDPTLVSPAPMMSELSREVLPTPTSPSPTDDCPMAEVSVVTAAAPGENSSTLALKSGLIAGACVAVLGALIFGGIIFVLRRQHRVRTRALRSLQKDEDHISPSSSSPYITPYNYLSPSTDSLPERKIPSSWLFYADSRPPTYCIDDPSPPVPPCPAAPKRTSTLSQNFPRPRPAPLNLTAEFPRGETWF